MDIDIDDILAELDRDTTAVEQNSSSYPDQSDDTRGANDLALLKSAANTEITVDPTSNKIEDYQKLVTHWRNERMSPELLPYPHHLMARTLVRIQDRMEFIETLSMGYLEDSRELTVDSKLPLLCMEAELERLKFVVRSFIRCRLSKIDKYSIYLRQQSDSPEIPGFNRLDLLMSKEEVKYHMKHSNILLKLFNSSVLKHLPEELQAINDTEGSISMIDEPDWNKTVFILVCGGVLDETGVDPKLTTDDDGKPCYSVVIEELNEEIYLLIGAVYVIRYSVIVELMKDGRVILI
ncbi:unnamed protein product [Kluyveromyces dobzhanskii CBS 2104]|uniref:DNA replication complex GINS protein SLD5 n=1 Tax=Kluyveromyces dobzhanskii CBS 2104 TaxID=1427455 RepID=A0A0A8LC70_9SACH|nr:unnamed protein product [Kluyveromyces dobzhanskii CBS 2104]